MGSDTCGSIRIPASHHALVGLRGTRGLSSRDGIIPLSHTQDIGGPLARTVADLVTVLDATVGPDPADESTKLSQGNIPESYAEFWPRMAARGPYRCPDRAPGGCSSGSSVREVIEAAIEEMKEGGAEALEITESNFLELLQDASVGRHEFRFDLANYLDTRPVPR